MYMCVYAYIYIYISIKYISIGERCNCINDLGRVPRAGASGPACTPSSLGGAQQQY